MEVDIAQFFGCVIDHAGGEIRVPYEVFEEMEGNKAISIDLEEEDGKKVLVFRLVDEGDVVYADA